MSRTLKAFEELGRCQIGENMYLVISQANDGTISIAQLVSTVSDGRSYEMFLKNAIRCESVKTVDDITDMLQKAKEKIH